MENQIFINPTKASSKPFDSVGVYIGKVMRIEANGDLFVRIPHLSSKRIFGPCKNFGNATQVDAFVIVSFLDSRLDEPVVIGSEKIIEYKIGDTGPGGGIIFFVDTDNSYQSFTYLEALDPSLAGAGLISWADSPYTTSFVYQSYNRGLGRGKENTDEIIAQGNSDPSTCAAVFCNQLAYNGFSWYLPSHGEMRLIYENLYMHKSLNEFFDPSMSIYWTSTQDQFNNNSAIAYDFTYNYPMGASKASTFIVCPVRRF